MFVGVCVGGSLHTVGDQSLRSAGLCVRSQGHTQGRNAAGENWIFPYKGRKNPDFSFAHLNKESSKSTICFLVKTEIIIPGCMLVLLT